MGSASRERLPITPDILRKMKGVWLSTGDSKDTKLIWAACCLCFFGFLRAGELTVPSSSEYDPGVHLNVGDLALDNATQPSLARVNIKQWKTDLFGRVSTSTSAGWGLTSVPLPLSLIFSRRRAPPQACFSPLRMAAYSPGSVLWTLSGMRCRRRVYHARSTAVTASASVQPLQLLQEVWRIVSFRHWAGGRAWPICVTCAFQGSSWWAT